MEHIIVFDYHCLIYDRSVSLVPPHLPFGAGWPVQIKLPVPCSETGASLWSTLNPREGETKVISIPAFSRLDFFVTGTSTCKMSASWALRTFTLLEQESEG